MALPITNVSDYVGEYQISTDKYSEKTLNVYISKYEKKYLDRLLGCELASLFIADLDPQGVPQTQRFIDIFNSFCKQDECGDLYESDGIKEMLLGFIYFEYVKNNNSGVATSGNTRKVGENSKEAGSMMHDLYARYNLSAVTASSIQWFICDNMDIYPEFEGVRICFNHWSL